MALKSRLGTIAARVSGARDRGVLAAATHVRDLARQLCPVDTGALKASGRIEPETPAPKIRVIFGGGDVDYAAFVEYGTAASPAQPFLTPAAQAISVTVEVAREIREILK